MRYSKGDIPRDNIKMLKSNLLFNQNIKEPENNTSMKKPKIKHNFTNIRSSSSQIIKKKNNIINVKMRSNIISFERQKELSDDDDENIIVNTSSEGDSINKSHNKNINTYFKHKYKDQTFNRTKIIPYNMNMSLKSKSPQYKLIKLKKIKNPNEEKISIGTIPKFNYNLKFSKYNKFITSNTDNTKNNKFVMGNINNNNDINYNDRLKTFNFDRKKEQNNNLGNYYHCRNCMILIAESKNNSKFYINN